MDLDDATKTSLSEELHGLKTKHRQLDKDIQALMENNVVDQLKIRRLKKEKLVLKDRIAILEDMLTPDIIA